MNSRFHRLMIFVLIPFVFVGCDLLSHSPQSNDVADSLRVVYQEDAARLALRWLYETGSADSHSVELPSDLVNTLYNALIHVHQSTRLAARDSVVVLYRIHTFPSPETRSLIVVVDSNAQWVQAWRRGERLTGNVQIDSLMQRFDLQLGGYYTWPPNHAAVLLAGRALNITVLLRQFRGIVGVIFSEPNGVCCEGNDIKALSADSYWQLDYSLGWGDCPAGCIARHYWTFRIHSSGVVEYVGSRGAPVPPNPL